MTSRKTGKGHAPISLCIHGHFYQPPRENPWTGWIDHQESAFPYSNWNERINVECYTANCFSRILDPRGRIEDVVNNFATPSASTSAPPCSTGSRSTIPTSTRPSSPRTGVR